MNRKWLTAALLLPIIGLGTGIALQETGARGATTWRIPVTGYDPRDPIRGHYIQFRYDWRVEGPAHLCRNPIDCALCLEDGGTAVRVVPADESCPARVDHVKSRIGVMYAPEAAATPLAAASRLFVSERSAPKLEAQLRERPMVVVARLTRDGRLINDRLEPKQGE